jgi:oligopeptide transport system substrate-binding protein
MPHFFRRLFPYLAIGLLLAALAWATSFGTLPPADFTFDNGNEVETIDPSQATGQPEHRVINGLFEGLLRNMPPQGWEQKYAPGENVPLTPQGGMAAHFDLSEDGRVYTFHLRPGAKWTDGTPVTANDFAWSWRRTLHPETASRYAYQLYYIVGAKEYNLAQVEPGGRVEVELPDRRDPLQPFPRGTVVRGILKSIHKPPEPKLHESESEKERTDAEVEWKKNWLYVVEEKRHQNGSVDWDSAGQVRQFSKTAPADLAALIPPVTSMVEIEPCLHVLPDFEATVGIEVQSPAELVVKLNSRTPYFKDLLAFYPLYPVNPRCVEAYGSPDWTKPQNIVTNGPFRLQFRRIRDRIRMVRNEMYWDADNVQLRVIDGLAMKSETTALNMYLNGQLDWIPSYVPMATIPILKRDFANQFRPAPQLITYFYRVNVTRPELRDRRVRQALNLAIDKRALCERVTRAGEIPASALVPPGISVYVSPAGPGHDVVRARKLLEEAGYAGGRGLPTIEILYNDLDMHRTIAETIQQMWRENLGVDAELRGLEWGVYLDSTHKLDYDVARAGWVADYPDPNTYLDMFMTGNENNQTGWGNTRYDELIRRAGEEPDSEKRMELLKEAEAILINEAPILPIYFYVSKNLVRPRIEGFFNTVQDEHPLTLLRVKD